MRSYKQHCGLAKALDAIGDRWSLLIVRELLIRDSCRYTDLQKGLPGIATNLLADRLRELEKVGVIFRQEAPPPIATTLFHLTNRGRELEPIVLQLGKWGAPLLADSPPSDKFCPHWLLLPLKLHLRDRTPEAPSRSIELRTGGESLTVATADGAIRIRLGAPANPDFVVAGDSRTILGLMSGRIDLARALAAGLKYEGDPAILRRVVPDAPSAGEQAAQNPSASKRGIARSIQPLRRTTSTQTTTT